MDQSIQGTGAIGVLVANKFPFQDIFSQERGSINCSKLRPFSLLR